MKNLFKYIFSIFLLAAILVSTFGISINKMRCLESGNVAYSFFEAEDCCPPSENTETTLDLQCCEFSKINFHSGISEIIKQEFFKKISFVNFVSQFLTFTISHFHIFSVFFSDTSPPHSTTVFLSLISVFRI